MKYGSLILEKKEYVYLKRVLNISGYVEDSETQKSFQKLNEELKTAKVVDENDVPNDVVRFNSKVTVASNRGWEKTIQIVIPADKDVAQNKVSILTPIGSALFGYSKSDVVNWDFPSGNQQLEIKEVLQVKYDRIEVTI